MLKSCCLTQTTCCFVHMSDLDDDVINLDGVVVHPNEIFSQIHTELAEACFKCDLTKVKSILDDADDYTAHDLLAHVIHGTQMMMEGTPLMAAILMADMDLARYLASHRCCDLEQECDSVICVPTVSRGTSLMLVCELGSSDAASILLQNGADPNHGTAHSTPLILACIRGSKELVSVLLKHGADPCITPYSAMSNGTSLAFYIACLKGDLSVVEVLVTALKNDEVSVISLEQLILCRTLLGLSLLPNHNDYSVGLTFWRRALSWFNDLIKPRYGMLEKEKLSHELHALYLTESALVQTGKKLNIGHVDLLPRTHSRFPDFNLCVSPSDLGDDYQVESDITHLHTFIVKSCIASESPLFKEIGITFANVMKNISESQMYKENKRLCSVVVLENAITIRQFQQILDPKCTEAIMSMILNEHLYVNNPGYVMLLLDILNEAVRGVKDTMNIEHSTKSDKYLTAEFEGVSEMVVKMIYLAMCSDLVFHQKNHLANLVRTFINLAKEVQAVIPVGMEFQMMMEIVFFLLGNDNAFLSGLENGSHSQSRCLELLHSFLCCGVDPNARDNKGNTVMLLCLGVKEPYRSDAIELLMTYGGHLDTFNYSGNSPYQILCTLKDCRIQPINCRTLKCRAASTISFFKIGFRGLLPKTLEEFVDLHDTHTPTRWRGSKKTKT